MQELMMDINVSIFGKIMPSFDHFFFFGTFVRNPEAIEKSIFIFTMFIYLFIFLYLLYYIYLFIYFCISTKIEKSILCELFQL